MSLIQRRFVLVAILIFASSQVALSNDEVDFANDIYPIFVKHCVSCHSEDDAQGSLVMTSFATLMKGGEFGPVITPGVPASSRLYLMASGQLEPVMPPDDVEGPDETELQLIATWIEQGAKGPEGLIAMRRDLVVPAIAPQLNVRQPVTAMAISLDGRHRIKATYRDVQVFAEDPETPITVLENQPGKINSVCFSRDGEKALVASGVTGLYGHAAILDVRSGKQILSVEGHSDAVQVAIFSPDERFFATASYDREILLWDAKSGKQIQRFTGHNGAVNALAFSPDGRVLISGSADETVKVWEVTSGNRLDTMSQPTGEVFSVKVTHDGKYVIAGSADNRLRVWHLKSHAKPQINPLVATRYVDESPLIHLALSHDGKSLIVISDSGNVKVLRTSDWSQVAALTPIAEVASDITIAPDDHTMYVSLMNGDVETRVLPTLAESLPEASPAETQRRIYVDIGVLQKLDEPTLRKDQGLARSTLSDSPMSLPRGAEFSGIVSEMNEEDWFSFRAEKGEVWAIETDTTGMNSSLDSIIEICGPDAKPITLARLQATRDSYFTFRGKNSIQNDDFRVFAWEEMKLNEYLYANGEVTKLWLAPRGADSGFNVYPGQGNRWAYFGTSGTVHALGEPAYIVRPLGDNEPPSANGLPVFEIPYVNDDVSTQDRGKDSYLLFHAPQTQRYLIRLKDTRGEGGPQYTYRLQLRPAEPGFKAYTNEIKAPIRRGTGRELKVNVDRIDGYEGEVWFDIDPLPPGLHSNFPVRIQPGQSFAIGNIWADEDAKQWTEALIPKLVAHAMVNDRRIERPAGTAGTLTLGDRPNAIIEIVADGKGPASNQDPIKIRRGETITLLAKASRADGFTKEIPLGKEQSGRNLPHGVYVDNIGLNGLLIREGESERQFYITADPVAELGKRDFFLTGEIDGNITSAPVTIEVVP